MATDPTRTTAPDGAPEPTRPEQLAPGAVLAGRYRIVAPLGAGGMGEVFRADDLKLGQPVAIKFLPARVAADPARRARLFAEVKLARQVSHPNVCRVHDVGETGGLHFLTMEYVDGEDLASLLRRIGRLPQDKGIEVARQVCIGLAAAHERGVVHRDLKPANVMIDGRGRARLTDFGLAVLADEAPAGEVAGTPAYMAPEQLAGEPVTPSTDVYALGLVMYEVFTGRRAFPAPSSPGSTPRDRNAPPPPPSSIVPDLDPTLERVILACLDRDPGARPPSAIAVAARLPGADPLAALVAAGQTPQPEMVAAAGGAGTLSPRLGIAALVTVLLGVPLAIKLFSPFVLFEAVPLPKRPEVLDDRAREIPPIWAARRPSAPSRTASTTATAYANGGPGRGAWTRVRPARPSSSGTATRPAGWPRSARRRWSLRKTRRSSRPACDGCAWIPRDDCCPSSSSR